MTSTLVDAFDTVLRSSFEASVMAGLILFVQLLCKPLLTPRIRYSLWLLLVVKVAIPVSIPAPWSVYNLFPSPDSAYVQSSRRALDAPTPRLGDAQIGSQTSTPAELTATRAKPLAQATVVKAASAPLPLSAKEILTFIWIVGVFISLARFFAPNLSFALRLRKSKQPLSAEEAEILEQCWKRLRIAPRIQAWRTPLLRTPAAFGIVRGDILIPATLSASPQDLEHIFLHELGHIKNCDLPVHWLASLVRCFHWFNPVLAFCWRRMEKDREMACDAWVLCLGGSDPQSYGATLLKLLQTDGRRQRVAAIAMAEPAHGIEERFRTVLSYRKSAFPQRCFALLILAIVGLAAMPAARLEPVSSPEALAEPGLRPQTPKAPSDAKAAVTITVHMVESDSAKPVSGQIMVRTKKTADAESALLFRTNCPTSGMSFKISDVYSYQVAVTSDAQRSQIMPPTEMSAGDQDLVFRFGTGRFRGRVISSEGRSVAGAEVVTVAAEPFPYLSGITFFPQHPSDSPVIDGDRITFTDDRGAFACSPRHSLDGFVAVSSIGFGRTSVALDGGETQIILEPWASLEGLLVNNRGPIRNQEVLLVDKSMLLEIQSSLFRGRTDNEGHFFFPRLPSGGYFLTWDVIGLS